MAAPRYAKSQQTRLRQAERDVEILKRRPAPAGLPNWTELDLSGITIDDGEIDPDLSYIFAMIQDGTDMSTVFVQMRIVGFGSFGPQVTNLPGLNFGDGIETWFFAPILSGYMFTSVVNQWDTWHLAYMSASGECVAPLETRSVGSGDVMFVGGGAYPYNAPWPVDYP